MPAAQLGYCQARFRFVQKANDLFFCKSLFHVQSPVYGIGLQAYALLNNGGTSTLNCLDDFAGKGQLTCPLPAVRIVTDQYVQTVAHGPCNPVQPPKIGGDSDGDNDGTKAAAIPSIPFIVKPTATLGNNVNVTA